MQQKGADEREYPQWETFLSQMTQISMRPTRVALDPAQLSSVEEIKRREKVEMGQSLVMPSTGCVKSKAMEGCPDANDMKWNRNTSA